MDRTLVVQRVFDDEVYGEINGVLELHQRPGALMVVRGAGCFDKHIEVATTRIVIKTRAKDVARGIITEVTMQGLRDKLALLLAKSHVVMVALR